jgi:hypothetical protein
LRDDWAAQQICLSYDLSVVGNRWIDLFLSAGLSPHRVHHVLPYQGSGFANLASEDAVREVCAEAGIAWERPRNLIVDRFPTVIKHYLTCPVKPSFLRTLSAQPPADMEPPPGAPPSAGLQPRPGTPPPPGMQPPPGTPPPPGMQAPPGPQPPPVMEPPRPSLIAEPPRSSVKDHLSELFRYSFEGWRGIGV